MPEVMTVKSTGRTVPVRNGRIPLVRILQALQTKGVSTDLVDIYRQKVLTQKTRTIRLLGRKGSAKIIHSLLGYEVQASYKRIHCPDLVTARYVKLFSDLGCHSINLPYDPSVTAQLIPELENEVQRIVTEIHNLFPSDHNLRIYVVRRTFKTLRERLSRSKSLSDN